ncbi:MAG: DNA polymerase III subunit beta [Candidatus Symbiobacter sp.]|nr:DNA polymerase III subunit beta [Candidatus Symbiobacter sp.]
MKISINRDALLTPLSHVQGLVPGKPPVPIMGNLMLKAESGKIRVYACDLDLDHVELGECQYADTNGGEAATTVNAHIFYNIIRKMPEGAEIEIDGPDAKNHVSIRAGRTHFELPCLSAEDFPVVKEDAEPHQFDVPLHALKQALGCTKFAMSSEETRYYLNGIYIHAKKDGETPVMRFVATDGHRLARTEIPLPEGAVDMPAIIVSRKAITELGKLLDEFDGNEEFSTVHVAISDKRIRFAIGTIATSSKLIDASYPDYERVIPKQNDKTMEVTAEFFRRAVDRVSAVNNTGDVRPVKFTFGKNNLTLSVSASEGNSSEEIDAATEALDFDIGFNPNYLLDLVPHIASGTACFDFSDANSPVIIRDKGNDSMIFVVMPMRV